MSEKQRVRLTLSFSEISWDLLIPVLVANPKVGERKVVSVLKAFARSLRSPLGLKWLGGRRLSKMDHAVVLALCEHYGADSITIVVEREVQSPLLRLGNKGSFVFDPFFKRDGEEERNGHCTAEFCMSLCGKEFWIRNLSQGLLFYLLLAILGIASYVVLVGFLIYAVSVFLLFLAEPWLMTVVATTHASVGLALICLLVGLAGLCGRAVRNLVGLVRSRSIHHQRESEKAS